MAKDIHQWQPWGSQEYRQPVVGEIFTKPSEVGFRQKLCNFNKSPLHETGLMSSNINNKKRSCFTHIPKNNHPNNHKNDNNKNKDSSPSLRPLPFLHLTSMVYRRIRNTPIDLHLIRPLQRQNGHPWKDPSRNWNWKVPIYTDFY